MTEKKRYYVITEFAVEASDRAAAEQMVVHRIQDMLGIADVVVECEECGHFTQQERQVGNKRAGLYVDARLETDEEHLRKMPAMLVEVDPTVEVDPEVTVA